MHELGIEARDIRCLYAQKSGHFPAKSDHCQPPRDVSRAMTEVQMQQQGNQIDLFQYVVPVGGKSKTEELYLTIAEHKKRASELLHIFWAADLSETDWTGKDWSYHDATLNPQDALAILQAEKEGLFFWSKERGWQLLSPKDYMDAE